jgi:hypothetical protein
MKWNVLINVAEVEADTKEEAKVKAEDILMSYSESNSGSEILSNAEPILIEDYMTDAEAVEAGILPAYD